MNENSNEPIRSGEIQQPGGVEAKSGWFSRKIYETQSEKKKGFS